MGSILARFIDILRLRSGPQDMPGNWSLAIVLCLAYIAEGFYADHLLDVTEDTPRSLLAITVQFLAVAILLNIKRVASRLPQTRSALAGAGILFGFMSLLLISQAEAGKNQPVLALIWFAVFLWSLAVDAHIYRHALSITMSLGVLVAVMIFAVNFILIETVFG
jgi:hypothetical protein